MAKDGLDLQSVIAQLSHDYPNLVFVAGDAFYWSPVNRRIVYKQAVEGTEPVVSLLHEVGHALLNHKHYKLDFELLQLEIAAWEEAKWIAPAYNITIEDDHVQDCLDSYRDWLHRRSICPSCATQALQQDDGIYRCFNCHTRWQVASSRFCRPYRRQSGHVLPDTVLT